MHQRREKRVSPLPLSCRSAPATHEIQFQLRSCHAQLRSGGTGNGRADQVSRPPACRQPAGNPMLRTRPDALSLRRWPHPRTPARILRFSGRLSAMRNLAQQLKPWRSLPALIASQFVVAQLITSTIICDIDSATSCATEDTSFEAKPCRLHSCRTNDRFRDTSPLRPFQKFARTLIPGTTSISTDSSADSPSPAPTVSATLPHPSHLLQGQ